MVFLWRWPILAEMGFGVKPARYRRTGSRPVPSKESNFGLTGPPSRRMAGRSQTRVEVLAAECGRGFTGN